MRVPPRRSPGIRNPRPRRKKGVLLGTLLRGTGRGSTLLCFSCSNDNTLISEVKIIKSECATLPPGCASWRPACIAGGLEGSLREPRRAGTPQFMVLLSSKEASRLIGGGHAICGREQGNQGTLRHGREPESHRAVSRTGTLRPPLVNGPEDRPISESLSASFSRASRNRGCTFR
jgi:hypothetical protein